MQPDKHNTGIKGVVSWKVRPLLLYIFKEDCPPDIYFKLKIKILKSPQKMSSNIRVSFHETAP